MSTSHTRARPTRHRLGQALSSALVLAIAAPHVLAHSSELVREAAANALATRAHADAAHLHEVGGSDEFHAMLDWIYQFGVPLPQPWSGRERNEPRLRVLYAIEHDPRRRASSAASIDSPAAIP